MRTFTSPQILCNRGHGARRDTKRSCTNPSDCSSSMLRFFTYFVQCLKCDDGLCVINVERSPDSTSGSYPSTSILITPTRSFLLGRSQDIDLPAAMTIPIPGRSSGSYGGPTERMRSSGIESTPSRLSSESPIGMDFYVLRSCRQGISPCCQSSRGVRLKCQNAPEGGRKPPTARVPTFAPTSMKTVSDGSQRNFRAVKAISSITSGSKVPRSYDGPTNDVARCAKCFDFEG